LIRMPLRTFLTKLKRFTEMDPTFPSGPRHREG
jgi:hypothetical protein